MQQPKKRQDIPLAETPSPDYRHLPTTKRKLFKDRPYTATAKDSSDYRVGFKDATEGKKTSFPSRSNVQGFREAKERRLTPKKK